MALPTISLTKGDTFRRDIVVTDAGGEPVDVSAWDWWITASADPEAPDDEALFQLSTADGTIVPGAETNVMAATGDPELTEDAAPGRYYLDVQYKDTDGVVKTYWRGYLKLNPQITKAR